MLNFNKEFKSEMYFSLKKAFKTFQADLLTIAYVEYSVYIVFVYNITENTERTVS